MERIFKKVENFIKEKQLIEDGDRILLAVSGGPDSTFLFHFFLNYLKKKKIEIKVAYIHHHLRKEAEKEVNFVKEMAEKFNIEFYREDIRIKGKNIEKKAREKRYEKLYEIAKKIDCNKIATGHTLDDNAETVIYNFLRGSGITGLSGILSKNKLYENSEIYVIRPLLCLKKKEIVDFLEKHKIEYLIDSSNLSLSFFRNRIRNEIIPFLEKYNPKIKKQLFKMADIIQKEEEFLKKYTEKIAEDILKEEGEKIIVDVEKFKKLDIAIQRRISGYIYRKIKKTPYINYQVVEKIRKYIENGKKEIDEEILKGKGRKTEGFEFKLNIPGKTEFGDFLILSEFVEFSEDIFKNPEKFTQYFDFSKIKGDIIVRNRKKGDKFLPLGMKNYKKLSRYMIDKKIPKSQRDKILIFENNGEIMWVSGYQISEKFKVEKDSKKILKIEVKKLLK